jgi:hypothetical protein
VSVPSSPKPVAAAVAESSEEDFDIDDLLKDL